MKELNKLILCCLALFSLCACTTTKQENPIQQEEVPTQEQSQEQKEEIIHFEVGKMESNEASDFDFAFVKMHDENENKVFSPISMKYAKNVHQCIYVIDRISICATLFTAGIINLASCSQSTSLGFFFPSSC